MNDLFAIRLHAFYDSTIYTSQDLLNYPVKIVLKHNMVNSVLNSIEVKNLS